MQTHRRTFLLGGLGGASAVLLGACAESSSDAAGGTGVQEGKGGTPAFDAQLLNEAYRLEQTAIASYEGGARLLTGGAAALVTRFLDHERRHAERLEQVIRASGGEPVRVEEPLAESPNLRTPRDFLEFAVEAEGEAIFTYTELLPRLSQPRLRSEIASILTNEAQHAAALRLELGQTPVPDAIVTGA
jgi:rubrerythrin